MVTTTSGDILEGFSTRKVENHRHSVPCVCGMRQIYQEGPSAQHGALLEEDHALN